MKHCFQNDDGEIIAADTLEDAARYHDCELGGEPEPRIGEWCQLSDNARIPVGDSDKPGDVVTKTAREWADELDEVGYVASTYC